MKWHKSKTKFYLDNISFYLSSAYLGSGIVLKCSGQDPSVKRTVHTKSVDEGCSVKGQFWETAGGSCPASNSLTIYCPAEGGVLRLVRVLGDGY